jgi:hypothetical protein
MLLGGDKLTQFDIFYAKLLSLTINLSGLFTRYLILEPMLGYVSLTQPTKFNNPATSIHFSPLLK